MKTLIGLKSFAKQIDAVDENVFDRFVERFESLPKPGKLCLNSIRRYFESETPQIICPGHSDVGFCTLILRSNTPGLQLKLQNEEEGLSFNVFDCENDADWIDVECGEQDAGVGNGVLIVADCLSELTAGELQATPHRVVSKGTNQHRTSISFHVYADHDDVLDAKTVFDESKHDQLPSTATRVATVSLRKKKENFKLSQAAKQRAGETIDENVIWSGKIKE